MQKALEIGENRGELRCKLSKQIQLSSGRWLEMVGVAILLSNLPQTTLSVSVIGFGSPIQQTSKR
jgi:hypothetical protein